MWRPRTGLATSAILLGLVGPGCFFLPFRPDDGPDPWGDHPHGSDPDLDDDGDGWTETEGDCDDSDPRISPDAGEESNGVDDDCDGDVDEPPEPLDEDGDGWTPEDGDCDDTDPLVHPDAADLCDELDNDCDGLLNEDVSGDDPQEPNDAAPYHLGDLTNESVTVAGYLHESGDVDRFSLFVEDTWYGDFEIRIDLGGIPGDADYALELWLGSELVGYSDTSGGESIVYSGESFHDDTATYEIEVHSELGYSCSKAYLLVVEGSG
jgi:hypothetical protein